MTRKVLFIRPSATKEDMQKIKYESNYYMMPIGILSIIAYTKKYLQNVHYEILDFGTLDHRGIHSDVMYATIHEEVTRLKPDIVAISILASATVNHAQPIAHKIKSIDDEIAVVLGGVGPSVMTQDEILQQLPNVDGICYSEGEIPFLEVLKASDIFAELESNTSFITHAKILNEDFLPQAKLVTNLDEIPTLPIDMLDLTQYENAVIPIEGKNSVIMHTVRGCPFKCRFCAAPGISGNRLRCYSAQRVLNDLEVYKEAFPYNQLTILDEQLLFNKDRVVELIEGLSKIDVLLSIPNGMNISLIDEDIAKLFSLIEMDRYVFAIESGSQRVLQDVMKKPVSLEQAQKVLALMYTDRWETHSNFVIGMPGETEEDRKMTVDFIKNAHIDWSVFFAALPIRGSELYREAIDNGHLIVDESGAERISNEQINSKEMDEKAYMYNLECNFVHNFPMRQGNFIKARRRFDFVRNKYPDHAFAHYYFAECSQALGEIDEYESAMKEYRRCVSSDKKWNDYAVKFGLNR